MNDSAENISVDSQVDFVVMHGEYDNDGDLTVGSDGGAENTDGDGGGAVQDVAAASPTPSIGTVAGGADTTTQGAATAATPVGFPAGIAPGDGDLMPPRFTDDRNTDANDWLQDFLDYVHIRQIPKPMAAVLLRNRLTGAARKWHESLPSDITFDETVNRFRKRFATNAGRRDELLDGFWNRRQGPDEPASSYIETMVSMARRVNLDNEPLMRHAIVQGLRPDIRRDVRVLRPSTLEELGEAAAIGESNARLATAGSRANDDAVSAQLAEMRTMVTALAEIVAQQQRPEPTTGGANAPTQRAVPTTMTTTTAATAVHAQQNVVTTATPATSAADLRGMTVQLVMPPSIAAQHGSFDGRPARGRGRGYRGPWRGHETNRTLNAAAAPFRSGGTGDNIGFSGTDTSPTCVSCGRRHQDGNCAASEAVCYACGVCGHYARCCQYRVNTQPSH